MQKKLLAGLKLFTLLLLISLHTLAGDYRGGYISYTHTGNNSYHFKINSYTDPSDYAADRCYQTIAFVNLSTSTKLHYLNCPRTNSTPGANLVSSMPPFANCGSSSGPGQGLMLVYPFTSSCTPNESYGGVKYNLYEADYTFTDTGMYIISLVDIGLTQNINNLGGGSNTGNIFFALVDTLRVIDPIAYNNSPVASNYLFDSVCRGQTLTYNPGLTDIDGDSLSYSIIPFITSDDTTGDSFYEAQSYIPPSITINPTTGAINWPTTSTNCFYGEYDIDILVKEYRRIGGKLVKMASQILVVQYDVICCAAVGINKYINTSLTQIYPNPAQNNFTVEVSSNEKQTLQLFDVTGKHVLSQTINGKSTIDVSSLDNGVYFIQLKNGIGVSTQKIIVQH